eukprot:jgi/Phyca11/16933/fgenesh1_pg.PHYCAscaffold_23_\
MYLQHAHRRRLVAQGHHPAAHGADDPVENYKQVLKALNVWPSACAVMDEAELLRAHFVENDLTQRQCQELQDDLEQAQTLGQPELLKDLVDELKPMKKEHQGRSKVATCSMTTFLSASELSYEEGYVEDGQSRDE